MQVVEHMIKKIKPHQTELFKYKKGRVTELARKIQFKKYQQKVFDAVEKLNTKKNIDEVNKGKVASKTEKVSLPIGYLEYMTRSEGLESNFDTKPWVVVNSPYNREPFLEDEATFVKKTAYLIRWLYGEGSFNGLPVSLISNPHDNVLSGIKMIDCLLGKDRGHFLTVFKYLVSYNYKLSKSFWHKVIKQLNKENKKSTLCKNLQTFLLNGWKENLKGVSSSDEFTLKDFLDKNVYEEIYTKEETIEIRLETINTHKNEIVKINNDENRWFPHNYELVPFIDQLILRNEWGYSQMEIDKLCAKSKVLTGYKEFLSGRKRVAFSGYQSEPLMLLVASLNKPYAVEKGYNIYEFLSKPEKGCYIENIANLNVKNSDMKKWLNRINEVADYKDPKTDKNIWEKLHDAVTTHYDEFQTRTGRKPSNFEKIKGSSMDTGLLYLRSIHHIMTELGYGRNNHNTFEIILVEFLNYIIDIIENDSLRYENMLDVKAHFGTRMKGFFIPIVNEFIQYKKDNRNQKVGKNKLEKIKRMEARKILERANMPSKFPIMDRIRQKPDGSYEWEIRMFNASETTDIEQDFPDTGALCHFDSENNGGILSETNTFFGPSGDNIMMGDTNCEKTHLSTKGEFFKSFIKDNPNQPQNFDELEVWMNNHKLAKAYDFTIMESLKDDLEKV